MKTLAALLLLTVALAPGSGIAQRTWIGNVTLVSPERLDRVERGEVLVDDGRIVEVHRGEARAPEGAVVVDGGGRFLVPGLIDSHVHLAMIPGAFDAPKLDPRVVGAYFEQLPRSYLYYGYTTLVDLVVFDRGVLARFRTSPLHPDLYDCGPAAPIANGYPTNFSPAGKRFEVFPNFLFDPANPTAIPADAKPEDHTPEAVVARVKASGAICVKTFIERGFAKERSLPIPEAPILTRLAEAAHRAGLLLVIHANGFESQRMALDGGADVIAHGMWHWGGLDRESDVPAPIAGFLDRVAASHVGYQPTMRVLYGETAYFDHDYLQMPALRKVVPAAMIDWFRSPAGQAFRKEIEEPGASDADMLRDFARGPIRRVRQATAYLDRKGGNLVFGTDTPSAPTYGNLPGLNGYLEMREWQAAGISLERIFRAATLDNARRFHLDKDVGSIEPGKVANLLLLDKSPLDAVDAYDSIVTVWIRGKAVAREALAAGPAPPSPPAAR
jgi:imidazolonepropionase-like amidohydrolase